MQWIANICFLVIVILVVACLPSSQNTTNILPSGAWVGFFKIDSPKHSNPIHIPFRMQIDGDTLIYFDNGSERIKTIDVFLSMDSFHLTMPVFGSSLEARFQNDTFHGVWSSKAKESYHIPFYAVRSVEKQVLDLKPIPMRWKVQFSPLDDPGDGILLLQVDEFGIATATVRTETGDYRFLEGSYDGTELSLSAFDGAHIFYLQAQFDGEKLQGGFWSGKHWYETWIAYPDDTFTLRDPDSLTFLSEPLAFQFPNVDGDTISLNNPMFDDKVTIVQITGSWCPNCMDETRVLVDMYKKYQKYGLEIVAIDFELKDDFSNFQQCVYRLQSDLGVTYPVLFGGLANKKEAAKKIPMLNHIMSYPTMILLDKNKDVKQIHTGFNGPSTGELYRTFIDELASNIEEILAD